MDSGNSCPQCGHIVPPSYFLPFSLYHSLRMVSCSSLSLSISRWMRATSTCPLVISFFTESSSRFLSLMLLSNSRRLLLASKAAFCACSFALKMICWHSDFNVFICFCFACSLSYCLRMAAVTSAIALSMSAISLSARSISISIAWKSSFSGIILWVWSMRGWFWSSSPFKRFFLAAISALKSANDLPLILSSKRANSGFCEAISASVIVPAS